MSGYPSVLALLSLLGVFCIRSEAATSFGILEKLSAAVLGRPVVPDTKHGQEPATKHVEEPERVVEMVER
jgi:hypothetical protein